MPAGTLFLPLFRRNFGGGVDQLQKFWGGGDQVGKFWGGGDERPKKWLGRRWITEKMGGWRCAAEGRAKPHPPLRVFLAPSLNESIVPP